jgi:hypothetical protein
LHPARWRGVDVGFPGHDPTGFQHALVDVHGNYRAHRLSHEPPDELISDVVTARTWRPHAVRSGFFFGLFVIVSIISFFTWIIAIVVAATTTNFVTGESSGSGSFALSLAYFLLVVQVLIVVAWIVALFLPLREPIAEYGLLIEGRAAAHVQAYWWIMNTARTRQSPFNVRFGTVQGLPVLQLVNGREHGLVVVRPVGMDLYVGWTMWRARSTVIMIGHMFRDMFQSGLAGDVRSASGRALRELIHSITREGVQAAILQPPVPEDVARAQVSQLPSLDAPTGPIMTVPQYQHAGTVPGPSSGPPAL